MRSSSRPRTISKTWGDKGVLSVGDRKIKEMELSYHGETIRGDGAVAKMIEVNSPVKVTIYTVDAESQLGAILGHSVGRKTPNEQRIFDILLINQARKK